MPSRAAGQNQENSGYSGVQRGGGSECFSVTQESAAEVDSGWRQRSAAVCRYEVKRNDDAKTISDG